ncbi:prosaposin-like [Ptychodera flava]|uniref:prosaposin-like n=1 Tax=Ptychodera flava TaxID=63121 RepID=UPI003969BEB9
MLLRLSLFAAVCFGLAAAGPAVPAETLEKEEGVLCDTCLQVVQLVYNRVTNNQTEGFIRGVLEGVCAKIPGRNRSARCRRFVDTRLDEIFAYIERALDPETFCFTIRLCRDKYARINEELARLDNEVAKPGTRHEKGAINDLKALQEILTAMEIVHQFDEEPTLNCMLCDTVVDVTVQTRSMTTARYDAYESALDLCDVMKGELAERCSNFVYMYLDYVLDYLDEGSDRNDVCPSLGACYLPEPIMYDDEYPMMENPEYVVKKRSVDDFVDDDVERYLLKRKRLIDDVMTETDVESDVSCVVCDWLVGEVDQWITQKKTEDEIKEKLEAACQYAPEGSYRDECQTLVDRYADTIIDMIVKQGLKPDVVCQKIGFCEKTLKSKEESKSSESKSSESKSSKSKSSESKSSESKSSESKSSESKSSESKSSSEEIKEPQRQVEMIRPEDTENPEYCEFCKTMVKEMDQLLEDNKDKIKNLLDTLCSRLPAPYGQQCKDEIDQNFDEIIELLELTILSPDTLCTSIGACTANQDKILEEVIGKDMPAQLLDEDIIL